MPIELDRTEMHHILERFEKLKPELSYETIPHTKVSPDYNLCLAIPVGTKCYAWITFYGEKDVCFIMELNKERKIFRILYTILNEISLFTNGTLFYGTRIGEYDFVIEDILLYQGISAKTTLMNEKLGFLSSFMTNYIQESTRFYLPALWHINTNSMPYHCTYDVPQEYEKRYPIHHIQYRCLRTVAPYLNVYPSKKGFQKPVAHVSSTTDIPIYMPYKYSNLHKPQYHQPTIFKVMADFQFDIYRLFAFGSQKSLVYYNVAYIPTYKSSVFMNSLFRNIKENANLDAIEESDDEDDFENTDPEKYVDVKKSILMECRFHQKFKKWVPVKVVSDREKVVHIGQL
jgi:hypothetical protein